MPIPRLLLALEARLDFVRRTNPFGSSKGASKTRPPPTGRVSRRWPPSPEHRAQVARDVRDMFGAVSGPSPKR